MRGVGFYKPSQRITLLDGVTHELYFYMILRIRRPIIQQLNAVDVQVRIELTDYGDLPPSTG